MLLCIIQVLNTLLETERELRERGGFLPLMALAPTIQQAKSRGWKYAAHPMDDVVRQYTATRVSGGTLLQQAGVVDAPLFA
jgi:hypothetical protein